MPRRLVYVTVLYVVLMAIGTGVAIAEKLPYEAGHRLFGVGDPNRVVQDWLYGFGTALSPPALVFIILIASIFLLYRTGWLRKVGIVAIMLVGLLDTIGGLAEPLTWESVAAATFDTFKAVIAWGGVLAAMLMWAFALAELLPSPRVEATSSFHRP